MVGPRPLSSVPPRSALPASPSRAPFGAARRPAWRGGPRAARPRPAGRLPRGRPQARPRGPALAHVSTDAERAAAALLRALAFYEIPAGRSPLSRQAMLRMRTEHEAREIRDKAAGTSVVWRAVAVTSWVATWRGGPAPDPGDAALAPLVLPAGDVAVGCVDLNVGASIPSELLVGRLPADGAGGGRAYLSNVAVADFARRRGVATRLVDAAAEAARGAGVRHLYVHVEARNGAGVALYQGLGFAVESAEAERVARGAGRPARLLLRRALD